MNVIFIFHVRYFKQKAEEDKKKNKDEEKYGKEESEEVLGKAKLQVYVLQNDSRIEQSTLLSLHPLEGFGDEKIPMDFARYSNLEPYTVPHAV